MRLSAFFLLAACAHQEVTRDIAIAEPRPKLKIVRRAEIVDRELFFRPVSFEFGAREDGTHLLAELIANAEAQGALYLTNLRVTIADGKQRCTTEISPQDQAHTETRTVPGAYETRTVPQLVTRTVSENEYRCHLVSRPVQRTETYYENQYDASSHTSRSVPRTRMVMRNESQNECKSEPVTHTVSRYEYQFASEYIPPRLESFVQHATEMVEGPPLCEPSNVRTNTISALAWFAN